AVERPRQDGQVHEPPGRERKAGCKNFFWKTFTSC
nr:RecName: Full=Somatostatin; Contains: RecName: Full=Somatostatin-34; Contains: RecName: Full=Somatostatin-14; Flags: Precursor [Myxine glutinosa]